MVTPTFSSDAEPPVPEEEFDALLAAAQPRLRAYIMSILGGGPEIEDLVQETNLVLLRKREIFEPGTNFIAWAFRVAYLKVKTWQRDHHRKNRAISDAAFFHEMADVAEQRFTEREPPTKALQDCLKQLSPREQELLHVKYVQRRKLVDYAEAIGASAPNLHKTISRIRLALRHCLQLHHGIGRKDEDSH